MNRVMISGTVVGDPKFSHEVHGKKFYWFEISSTRLSGTCDVLPCIISESLVGDICKENKIVLFGEVRTWNMRENDKCRLMVNLFVKSLSEYTGTDINSAEIQGAFGMEPHYKVARCGKKVSEVIVAVNRNYKKTDYIPCVFWGTNAVKTSELGVGTNLAISGRLQSRKYIKFSENGEEERTTYEVSANCIEVLARK